MGAAMGVKDTSKKEDTDESGPAVENTNGEIDYKKSSGFASHVKKKSEGGTVSEFATRKSIRQQREYLPVFAVREDLLNVIRENMVVIIVGETGSGYVQSIGKAKS